MQWHQLGILDSDRLMMNCTTEINLILYKRNNSGGNVCYSFVWQGRTQQWSLREALVYETRLNNYVIKVYFSSKMMIWGHPTLHVFLIIFTSTQKLIPLSLTTQNCTPRISREISAKEVLFTVLVKCAKNPDKIEWKQSWCKNKKSFTMINNDNFLFVFYPKVMFRLVTQSNVK